MFVFDNGSSLTKIGFSGDDYPKAVFSTVVGRNESGRYFVGDEALSEANKAIHNIDLVYPIPHGIIEDWDMMERIWRHSFFTELEADVSEIGIFLTEPLLNPKPVRERLTKIMFETFNAKSFYVKIAPVLSLYASGRLSGIVIDFGGGRTEILPVYLDHILPHAIKVIPVGGNTITRNVMGELEKHGYSLSFHEAEKIKELSLEVRGQRGWKEEKNFCCASNGTNYFLGNQRYEAMEIYFREPNNVAKAVVNCITDCDVDIRRDFYSNLLMAGGVSYTEGLKVRLEEEVSRYTEKKFNQRVNVIEQEEQFSNWIGGSISGMQAFIEQVSIKREEYQEEGARIVHRRCF